MNNLELMCGPDLSEARGHEPAYKSFIGRVNNCSRNLQSSQSFFFRVMKDNVTSSETFKVFYKPVKMK